ncbi:hypothetical protein HK096_006882, partial [Nowakowskiella sp. JEL0078]
MDKSEPLEEEDSRLARPKSARPSRDSKYPVSSDFSDFGSDYGGETDSDILNYSPNSEGFLAEMRAKSGSKTIAEENEDPKIDNDVENEKSDTFELKVNLQCDEQATENSREFSKKELIELSSSECQKNIQSSKLSIQPEIEEKTMSHNKINVNLLPKEEAFEVISFQENSQFEQQEQQKNHSSIYEEGLQALSVSNEE